MDKIENSPIIVTDRTYIRLLTEEDVAQSYLDWLNDKELMKFSEQRHHVHTYESCISYIREMEKSKNMLLGVFSTQKYNRHLGNLSIYLDRNNMSADLSILIGDQDSRNKGIGREVWCAILDYLFHELKTRLVTAGTMEENEAMLRLMRATGMQIDGRRRRFFMLGTKEVDLVHSSILREEYLKS